MIELISAVGCHETSSEGQLYLKNGCGQEKTAVKGKGMQGRCICYKDVFWGFLERMG